MEAPKTPRHPFEVRLSIGGDDWDDILRAVADIAKHFIERGPDRLGRRRGGCYADTASTCSAGTPARRSTSRRPPEWHEAVPR